MNRLSQNRKRSSIESGIVASLIAALVIAGLTYFASKIIRDLSLASFVAAFVGAAIAFLAFRFRILNPVKLLFARYLDVYTGIDHIYPSLIEASSDLKKEFAKAKRIELLLHIGRREFGSDELFYHTLKSRMGRADDDLEVRVLHISENSPYLSEKRAKELGKERKKWLNDVTYVRNRILEASGGSDRLQYRTHCEPFEWRLFFFDRTLFVSSYLHPTENDKRAPVFRIQQGDEGTNSLFSIFHRYYKHLWDMTSNPWSAETMASEKQLSASADDKDRSSNQYLERTD